MQMKRVDLLHGKDIQKLLDLVLVKKMPGDIKHYPSPGESRIILNIHAGCDPGDIGDNGPRINLRRQQLQQ